MKKYRSPYEAYPFLSEDSRDLRCDFEILTDEMASLTGLLASLCQEDYLKEELTFVSEIIYHLNPSLRTFFSVRDEELAFLLARVGELEEENSSRFKRFVLPLGSSRASLSHVLRAKAKELVRLIYRYSETNTVDEKIIDLANILSGYFFLLALELNKRDGLEEIEYRSRKVNFQSKLDTPL